MTELINHQEQYFLLEEAKRLTKKYAIQNKCLAILDMEYFYYSDGEQEMNYRFYAANINGYYKHIEDIKNIETLIKKIKEIVTQEKKQ